ncbi:hypothetical protein M0804_013368 [Polistes exclamans]|nr:hypothetical protein M0804_013368 [Polistes exclamans]
MGNGKAARKDKIRVEFLKALPERQKEEMRDALNRIWLHGDMAKGWEKARMVPIFKDGDRGKTENYREISVLDVGYKVLTKMTERLSRWIKKHKKLKKSQAGLRKGRGSRDQIFMLNAIINNRLKAKGGKLYLAFNDLKAAFDRVNREKMIVKLKEKGIECRMIEKIKEIYKETRAEVQTQGKIIESFRAEQGVRQDCALSVVLFDLYIDDLEERWTAKNEGGAVIGK